MMLTGVWPDGLEPAFTAYEDALMADDTAALDALQTDIDVLRGVGSVDVGSADVGNPVAVA